MAKSKKQPEVAINNFVAKHMHEVNRSQVFVDRKKDHKRGYQKHKQGRNSTEDRLFYCLAVAA
ncbi:hypothetical protein EC844_103153 [Acinetobacter calcoaceticus]|uniref:Uncharacterized protein n=1 Tax=Acinetobacter calcoaceticus TaxID=471 RepID=A0A4R1XYJ0_ACICA|nr:hypothetical protein EC844_103153 [Acinetobacter calcoaceticus]